MSFKTAAGWAHIRTWARPVRAGCVRAVCGPAVRAGVAHTPLSALLVQRVSHEGHPQHPLDCVLAEYALPPCRVGSSVP